MDNDTSFKTVQIGTLIYRGSKEESIEAIKKKTSEIINVIVDNTDTILQLQNLSDHCLENINLQQLYSRKQEPEDLLIFTDNFNSLLKRLSEVENVSPVLHSSTIPEYLLKRAYEIKKKLDAVDLAVSELRTKYQTVGVIKSFRKELLPEACNMVNQTHIFGYGIYPSTYYDYKKRLKECHDDIYRFASTLHRKTYNQTRIGTTSQFFIDTMILNYLAGDKNRQKPQSVYSKNIKEILERTGNLWINPNKCQGKVPEDLIQELLNPQIPFQTILNNVEKAALLSPVKLPSRGWFYSYFRWFKANPNQSEKEIRERFGDDFFESSILSFDTYIKRAMYPLHYVFADHCLLDIFIVDDETRSKPFKVWLTVLIDAYSRCILGIALLDEEPCIESIQSALQNAIWPKDDWLEANGLKITKPWGCFGYPVNLSMDNAWAHHSHSLIILLNRLAYGGNYGKIKLLHRPPYKGRYGALIERFFGNIQSQIQEHLKGAYKDREFKSIRNAKREACLLYSDLLQAIVTLITEYHHNPHSELFGMTPMEKWMEGLKAHIPIIPPPSNEIDRFFWRGYPSTRVILQEGIHLFDMAYWSPGLAKAQVVDWDKKKVEYSISYNVDDISTIAVFNENKWICDAKSKKLQIGSEKWLKISLTEMNLAKKIAKERFKSQIRWLECIYEFEKLNQQRKTEKKTANRKKSKSAVLSSSGNQPSENTASKSNDEITQKVVDFLQRSKREK